MVMLIISIILLLVSALTIVAIPFVKHQQSLLSKPYLIISSSIVLTSIVLYFNFGQASALKTWLSYGKNHYELAVKVEELGGIDGLIARLKKKLEGHPNDKKGLEMLRKLTAIKKNT